VGLREFTYDAVFNEKVSLGMHACIEDEYSPSLSLCLLLPMLLFISIIG